jgi:8-oxo-dGTP pyrophosphatase MutT (NUDIX family)
MSKSKLRLRQQVAAICYRQGKSGVEFLLVKTKSGRWIFPKGGVEPGLTHAQSAAIEAVEEAGVHGRIEELSFARYKHLKAGDDGHQHPEVRAHLCEVTLLESPKEPDRCPTWFSTEKAKQRLRKRRTAEFAAELQGVVDRATQRIQRIHGNGKGGVVIPPFSQRSTSPQFGKTDALQKVHFEATPEARAVFIARRFGRPVLQLSAWRSNPQQTSRE